MKIRKVMTPDVRIAAPGQPSARHLASCRNATPARALVGIVSIGDLAIVETLDGSAAPNATSPRSFPTRAAASRRG